MKSKLTNPSNLLTLLALALVASLSWATTIPTKLANDQEQSKASVSEGSEALATQTNDVEVIGVVGERSLLYFTREMEKAELDFYDAFNVLADEKKFIVQCRRTKRPGSNISDKVCHPQFVLDRMAQETQSALQTGAPLPKWEDVEFAVREERAESVAYVEKVVMDNPQLLDKLIALNDKQAMFEEQKKKSK